MATALLDHNVIAVILLLTSFHKSLEFIIYASRDDIVRPHYVEILEFPAG